MIQRGPRPVQRRERTYLEKVIDDEAVLTGEKPKTSPKKEALNDMSSDSHLSKLRSVPSNTCLYFSQYRV
jgi:hypothetical protein